MLALFADEESRDLRASSGHSPPHHPPTSAYWLPDRRQRSEEVSSDHQRGAGRLTGLLRPHSNKVGFSRLCSQADRRQSPADLPSAIHQIRTKKIPRSQVQLWACPSTRLKPLFKGRVALTYKEEERKDKGEKLDTM